MEFSQSAVGSGVSVIIGDGGGDKKVKGACCAGGGGVNVIISSAHFPRTSGAAKGHGGTRGRDRIIVINGNPTRGNPDGRGRLINETASGFWGRLDGLKVCCV